MPRFCTAALPPLLLLLGGRAPAQQPITDRAGCERCAIRAYPRITLRTEAAPAGLAAIPQQVTRDGRGNYWVLVTGQLPMVFSPRGAFLREVGRRGSGPGEFRGIGAIAALPGDSILLIDPQLQRASLFGPDLSFRRSMSLPVRAGATAVLRWPHRVVVNGAGFTPEQAGWPLHLLDLSRDPVTHLRAFGENRAEPPGGNSPAAIRRLFPAGDGSFWAADVVQYRLIRYGADGTVLTRVRRQTPVFPGESRWSIGSPDTPPPAFLETAAVRGDTLWVALRVPRPDWRDAWRDVRLPSRGEVAASRAPERTALHITRIEAIELRRGVVLAHRNLNGILVQLAPDLTAALYDLDENGVPRLRLIDLRLVVQ